MLERSITAWVLLAVWLAFGVGCSGGGSGPSAAGLQEIAAFAVTDQHLALSGANGSVYIVYVAQSQTVTGSARLTTSSDGVNFGGTGLASQAIGAATAFVAPPPATAIWYRVEARRIDGRTIVSNAIRFDPAAAAGAGPVTGLDPNGATAGSSTPQLRWDATGAGRYVVWVFDGAQLSDGRVLVRLESTGGSTETLDLGAPLPAGAVAFFPSALPLASGKAHTWFVLALDSRGATAAVGSASFTTP